MRSDGIVVLPPGSQHGPWLHHGGKQRLIEAFIAKPAVEAFDKRILGGFARRNLMPFHLPLLRPAQDRGQCQLRAAVVDHRQRLRTGLSPPPPLPAPQPAPIPRRASRSNHQRRPAAQDAWQDRTVPSVFPEGFTAIDHQVFIQPHGFAPGCRI
jgi:hypothetical protein